MSAFPVVFDDGSRAMVSSEKLSGALKDGGKLAQEMHFDDGSKAYVPFEKVHDAIADGGMVIGSSAPAGAPPMKGALPNGGDTGEGPIAQGLTTMETKLANMGSSALQGSTPEERKNNLTSQTVTDNIKKLNPIATDEGSLPMNIGATAVNVLPLAAGGSDSVIGRVMGAAKDAITSPAGQAAKVAAGAGLKELPSAAVRRIPYIGNVAADTYQAAADAYKNSKPVIPEPTRAVFPRKPIWADKGIEAGSPPISVDATPSEPYVPVRSQAPPVPADAAPQTPAVSEQPAMGKRASTKAVKQASALNPNATPQMQASALKQPIADIVDKTIPPNGKTVAANLVTKAKVEMALKQGDVEAATKALQDGADKAGLPAPKVNEPLVPGSKADLMDDRHVEESIRAQYDQHGEAAWREMLREQADRNSMDTPKWERVAASRTGADPAARVPYPRFTEDLKDITDAPKAELAARQNFIAKHGIEPPQDLTDILQKSVDAAKAAKK